ncbi:hypothetical protein ACJX0J_033555, partial [Zea mays]
MISTLQDHHKRKVMIDMIVGGIIFLMPWGQQNLMEYMTKKRIKSFINMFGSQLWHNNIGAKKDAIKIQNYRPICNLLQIRLDHRKLLLAKGWGDFQGVIPHIIDDGLQKNMKSEIFFGFNKGHYPFKYLGWVVRENVVVDGRLSCDVYFSMWHVAMFLGWNNQVIPFSKKCVHGHGRASTGRGR